MDLPLRESNEDIKMMIDHLNKKIERLKKTKPKNELLPELQNFYQGYIAKWMETYPMMNREVDFIYDEKMKNKILDVINSINLELNK